MPNTATLEKPKEEKPKTKPGAGLDRKIFEKRITALKEEYNTNWRPQHKEISTYIAPSRGIFDDMPSKARATDNKAMLDNTPQLVLRTSGAGISSGMTSPSRPWFRVGVMNDELMELQPVREWCDVVQERISNSFRRSNIYSVLGAAYEELSAFATACILVDEDQEAGIRGYNFTAGEYWIGRDSAGNINAFGRRYWKTVGQLVKEFGKENVSPDVLREYELGKKVDTWVAVLHLIEANDDRVEGYADIKNMPFRSLQWEESSKNGEFLRVGGYEEFPVLAPRWQTRVTSDPYGSGSPGWIALGDSRELQKKKRKYLLALDKLTDPPVIKDGMVTGDVNTLPGGVNVSSASVPNAGLRPVYQININLADLENSIQGSKQQIGQAFYADLFLMLSQLDRADITAREIAERHEEKLLMLGPMLESLESELLNRLIERDFNVLWRAGQIPEPPVELQGQDIRIEYISILAQAQKLVGITAIERVCTFVGNIMAAFPEAKNKLNIYEAVDRYADAVGIPAKIIRSDEAVARIEQAQQEAELKQQQTIGAQVAAKSAKDLSQAPLDKNTMLDATIAAMTGKPMSKGQPAKEPAKK